MDQDPDWGWARRTIGSLVSRGLSTNSIPLEMRGLVWSVIEPLTKDPNPTSAEERTKGGEFVDDSYTLSINTTRGEAMHSVIEYGLWLYRHIEKTDSGKESLLKEGLGLMPEAKTVLEKHLDPERNSSIAVRAVYGRFLPWLLLMDRSWTIAHIDSMLPPGQFETPLYRAAWQAYIVYVSPYDNVLEVLKEKYFEAVKSIFTSNSIPGMS